MNLRQAARIIPNLVSETIENESVLVNLETGAYYSLVGIGSVVWNELKTGRSVDEILSQFYSEYDASSQEINAAIQALLSSLVDEGLLSFIEPADDLPTLKESGANSTPTGRKSPFHAPRLSKFTDMQELLLLDPIHDVTETGWPAANDSENG